MGGLGSAPADLAEDGSGEPAEAAEAEDTTNYSCRHSHCDVNSSVFFFLILTQ